MRNVLKPRMAETNEKLYLRFFNYWRLEVTKDAQKKCCSKVAKFTGKIRIDMTMIFLAHEFFVRIIQSSDANGHENSTSSVS